MYRFNYYLWWSIYWQTPRILGSHISCQRVSWLLNSNIRGLLLWKVGICSNFSSMSNHFYCQRKSVKLVDFWPPCRFLTTSYACFFISPLADTEPPVLIDCLDNRDIIIPLERDSTDIIWNSVATASDNSGQVDIQYHSMDLMVNIFRSGNSQVQALNVPVGQTTFMIVAIDDSGNTAECRFTANVIQGKHITTFLILKKKKRAQWFIVCYAQAQRLIIDPQAPAHFTAVRWPLRPNTTP